MDAADERRAFDLYEDLLTLSPGERETRLGETCADQPALMAAVKAMFAADARGRLLLPTIPPTPRLPVDDTPMPERIGPFRLVSEVGRGGMGVVYRAERDDGLYEQSVAIKLIRSTLFSQRALAQFAIERRILAKLHHPHIAQMLEGGVTADGASYIVMELVEGAPVTDYADAGRLSLGERLDLFLQVATAIEHAHRNLVVHADIKPSNVVVCAGFGVKLLDFGISRLLSADEPGNGAYTPGFGSPERQTGLPATPADDIYALGVLMRALIADVPGVDGDLDAVADRACDADPKRRYGTVGALAEDIGRWRLRKPVHARPANRARRARLFWRRHRLAVSLAVVALGVVLATTIATTLLWRRAETARVAAEERFEETRALSLYLVNDVTTAIAPLPGSSQVQEQIAEQAERTLERLSRVPGATPEVRADSAAASGRVGSILATLDQRTTRDPRSAERALLRSDHQLRALIAARPDRADLRMMLAKTLIARANCLTLRHNDVTAALRVLDETDRLIDALLARDPKLQAARDLRWDADLMRAEALDRDGRFAPIPPLLSPVLRRVATEPPPVTAEAVLRLSQSWIALGDARYYLNDLPGALAAYRHSLAALSAPALSTDVRIVLRIIYDEFNLSSTLAELGRKPEALVEAERGVMQARRLRSFDDTPRARHMANIAETEYATELAANHRFDEAIAVARAAQTEREQLARLQPDSYDTQRAVPVGMRPFAEILRDAGHRGEACAVARDIDARWAALAKRWVRNGFDGGPERAEVAKLLAVCRGSA